MSSSGFTKKQMKYLEDLIKVSLKPLKEEIAKIDYELRKMKYELDPGNDK